MSDFDFIWLSNLSLNENEVTHAYQETFLEGKIMYEPCLNEKHHCNTVSEPHKIIQEIISKSRTKTTEEKQNHFLSLVDDFQDCLSSSLFSIQKAKIFWESFCLPKEQITYGKFTIQSEIGSSNRKHITMNTQDLRIEIIIASPCSQVIIELIELSFDEFKHIIELNFNSRSNLSSIDFKLCDDCELLKHVTYRQIPRLFKTSVSSSISLIFNIPDEELSAVNSSIDVCNIINEYLQLNAESVYDELALQSMYYNPQFVTAKLFDIVNIQSAYNTDSSLHRWLYYQLKENPENRLLNCGFAVESDENGPKPKIYIYNYIEQQFVIFYLICGKIEYRKKPAPYLSSLFFDHL